MHSIKIDPWSSENLTDYEHIFREFGLEKFPDEISKKLDNILFERNLVIAHRDFQKIMACIEVNKPFINITGIASSGLMHFGHKVDLDLFLFFKSKKAKNYFAVCDLDGYCSRSDAKIDSLIKAKTFAIENLSHALALGLTKKDVYLQSNRPAKYYALAFELSKKITENTYRAIYGDINLGKVSAVLLQMTDILYGQLDEFEGKMPSITGIGLDQDPHARLVRDLAKKSYYDFEVPSFIYFKHQSGLQEGQKMSSSQENTAIFLSDAPEVAAKKISNAFTGGRVGVEEQKKLGGNPDICKVFEFQMFHNENSNEVNEIYSDCKAGNLLCGACKQKLIKFTSDFLIKHQKKLVKAKEKAIEIINETKN